MDIEQVAIPAELKATDDQLRDPEAIPWVPQVEGVWFKPLRICPGRGSWTNLLRVTKRGTISLHRHLEAVEAWVLKGEWRYLERDWVARPGTFVFEPPGDIHTLMNTGEDEMVTLFSMHGPIEYIGAGGETTFTETAETKLAKYVNYCQENGILLAPIVD
jgi:2,4'-dihydroxyacetophenone dioxygenase